MDGQLTGLLVRRSFVQNLSYKHPMRCSESPENGDRCLEWGAEFWERFGTGRAELSGPDRLNSAAFESWKTDLVNGQQGKTMERVQLYRVGTDVKRVSDVMG